MKKTTSYIINEFICKDFFDAPSAKHTLTEKEDSGKSELIWDCGDKTNLCISNFDNDHKHIDLPFLVETKRHHLKKRVDHVVFELNGNQKWDVHLIEMKKGIEYESKWIEIKGKFRAGYLAAKAIAAVIDIDISDFYFYTTYKHASLMNRVEYLASRKAHSGEKAVKPQDEWSGTDFGLNLGDRLKFKHTPIEMEENDDGVLIGSHPK